MERNEWKEMNEKEGMDGWEGMNEKRLMGRD